MYGTGFRFCSLGFRVPRLGFRVSGFFIQGFALRRSDLPLGAAVPPWARRKRGEAAAAQPPPLGTGATRSCLRI